MSLPGYLGGNSDIIIGFSSQATAHERCKLGKFPIDNYHGLKYLVIMIIRRERL